MMLNSFNANLLLWIPCIQGSIRSVLTISVLLAGVVIVSAVILWTARKRKATKPTASKQSNATDIDYDNLLTGIEKLNGKAHCLLFAANSLKDLPVTVPVQIAVRLAQSRRCLLIDLDLKRNAVAQVFGLDDEIVEGPPATIRSVPTEFENLFVWPAAHFKRQGHMNIKQLVERACRQYDQVLIYAPYLTTLPDRRQIASVCTNAYAFGNRKDNRLKRLLDVCKCPVAQEL